MKKRPFFVLSAAILVAAGAASYAVASQGGGPEKIPNTKNFHATLSGYQETPANSTSGFGEFKAKLDTKAATPTIHFVFSYSNLEGQTVPGGKILFAHVHFGQTGVAGGVSYFLCDNSAVPATPQACPDNIRVGHGRGRHHRRQRDRTERTGNRARLVRRDRAGDAGGQGLREHPHDSLARRRDPRTDQQQRRLARGSPGAARRILTPSGGPGANSMSLRAKGRRARTRSATESPGSVEVKRRCEAGLSLAQGRGSMSLAFGRWFNLLDRGGAAGLRGGLPSRRGS